MLILLEGGDAVGKTTLANKLAAHIGNVTLLHKGPPQYPDIFKEYEGCLDFYRPGSGQHVVCDRWHIGEMIYGPLLRGQARMDEFQFRHVEMYLRSRGALLVRVDEDDEVVKQRIHGDDEQLINTLQASVVLAQYRKFSSTLPQTHSKSVDWIIKCAQITERWAAKLVQWPSYIGPPVGHSRKPGILLLGEINPHPEVQTAALTPYTGRCGHYLLQACEHLMNFGLGNACEGPVRKLWCTLGRPKVVALGRTAQRICQAESIPHGAVAHPQWARRFKAGKQEVYGALIEAAAATQEDLISWH